MFRKATLSQARLRLALVGPSGSGKTYTALAVASALAENGRVAVIDTERASASKYAGIFDFDTCDLDGHHPDRFISALQAAAEAKYDVVIIDSLSHAWMGRGGALALVDQKTRRGNSFAAWRDVTPLHNELVDAILTSPCHVIATMRAKTEYVQEKGPNGKTQIRKVGLAPVQRSGVEYEFDVVGDLDFEHRLLITKSRCHELADKEYRKPGADLGRTLKAWLSDGDPLTDSAEAEAHLREGLKALNEKHGKLLPFDRVVARAREKYGYDPLRAARQQRDQILQDLDEALTAS